MTSSEKKWTTVQRDRRFQLGTERRARTRERIMAAAYRLFATHGADTPTIDDIVAEAGVGRGTFYNHFDTREAVFRAVAHDVARDMGELIVAATENIRDHAVRVAMAFRLFVRFAIADESRGWILLRTIPLVGPPNASMKAHVEAEFAAAFAACRLRAVSQTAAVDMGMGFQLMVLHHLLVERVDLDYIEVAAETLLNCLGVVGDEARDAARWPLQHFDPIAAATWCSRREQR